MDFAKGAIIRSDIFRPGVRGQGWTGNGDALRDGRRLKRFERSRRPIPLEPEEIRRFQRLGESERHPRGQAGGIGSRIHPGDR